MNTNTTPPITTLFAAVLLAGNAIAGTPTTPEPKKTGALSLLSFANGKIVFDFQERLRWEVRDNNFDFHNDVEALTDDNWFLNRIRFGLMLKPVPWLKLYAQVQDAREWDSPRANVPGVLGAEGDDTFDLKQGYLELGDVKEFPLTLRVGRQLLSYGDERLIGSSDWNNIGRSFDAAKLRWEEKKWSLDAFASTVVVPKVTHFDNSDFLNGNNTRRGQVFAGLYFSTTALDFQTTDLYALYLREDVTVPGALGDTSFPTIGLRVKSKPGAFAHQSAPPSDGKTADGKSTPAAPLAPKPVGFDYSAEAAFQTGEVRGLDLTAFAINAGAGYTFDAPWLPRIGLEYNYASGDRDPADGDIETFQNLFPTNHKFYGIMDLTAWQNMQQIMAVLSVQPCKTVSAFVDYRAFFIASTDDSWYRANGTTTVRPLNAAARNAGKYEGSQVEFVVTWTPKKYLQFQAGYAHFFPGTYLRDTGAADGADFGYIQASVTF